MFVKPVDGRPVPDPERGGVLPSEGREVPNNQYWQRRIADGDVVASGPVADSDGAAQSEPAQRKGK